MATIFHSTDPARLVGLKQAVYVMECLVKGQSKEEIVGTLGADEQLVTMWISFLMHNHWIAQTIGGWSSTAKGVARSGRDMSTRTT